MRSLIRFRSIILIRITSKLNENLRINLTAKVTLKSLGNPQPARCQVPPPLVTQPSAKSSLLYRHATRYTAHAKSTMTQQGQLTRVKDHILAEIPLLLLFIWYNLKLKIYTTYYAVFTFPNLLFSLMWRDERSPELRRTSLHFTSTSYETGLALWLGCVFWWQKPQWRLQRTVLRKKLVFQKRYATSNCLWA